MHSEIENAATRLGLDLQYLREASETTGTHLKELREVARKELAPYLGKTPKWEDCSLDIVLCGSYGREEVTPQSDYDYLIVAHEVVHDPELLLAFRRAAERAREEVVLATPGRTGIFGGLVSAADMVDRIGLEDDTNADITHRLLILEESVSLLNEVRHYNLKKTILARYLYDYRERPKKGVPRFLLNDAVRYWRTIAVDYQAKRWRSMGREESGLRWFKLRTIRKLAFAGTLIALFGLPPVPWTPRKASGYPEAGGDAWVISVARTQESSRSKPSASSPRKDFAWPRQPGTSGSTRRC